jgi:GNAT superfamily N-acetyltransferase
MLPPKPRDLPDGCMAPLVVTGPDGRPAGLGICRHQRIPDDALEQVWGTVHRFELTPRLLDPATSLDELLGRWRDHLTTLPETREDDSAAIVNWPSRDVSGVQALIKHGMQPLVVLAVRAAKPSTKPLTARPDRYGTPPPGIVIRETRPDDLEAVTAMELGVIHYDAQVGGAIVRPATAALVREDTRRALTKRPDWAWVAERDGTLVGLVHVQPPEESTWIACMTRPGATAYLQTMFVGPHERGGGLGAALVARAHAELDARGITTTLLHYAQVNPLSAPFWNRMGYRPLWTGWETRPAGALRLGRGAALRANQTVSPLARGMIVHVLGGMLRFS